MTEKTRVIMGESLPLLELTPLEHYNLCSACVANRVSPHTLHETLYMAPTYEAAMDHIIYIHGNGIDTRK